ncbi:MAG: thiosulfate oxidation carrier complex protein SoxZ [Methylophilaceae bacterium]|jgi:sulfur-oxidizing protein SoxZ|nr:thiosulfate oxidation carrier complex protein SoxZ [Methylophilaceae bacterium]
MAEPMRIRAKLNGDTVEVKVLIRHDMETGKRKDPSGKVIPPHFIKTLIAKCKEKTVLDTVMGISVSKDPFLSFKFKGGALGDKVTVTWVDNTDDTRTDEATIS